MTSADETTLSVQCPVCDTLLSEPKRLSAVWGMFRCPSCTHVFKPDVSQQATPHNEQYEDAGFIQWRQAHGSRLRRTASRRLRDFARRVKMPPGRALEIGCSTGEALQELQRRGWSSYGIEVSRAALDYLRQTAPGVETICGIDMKAFRPKVEQFDLVMAFHVVEHIPRLKSFIADAYDVCNPGGYLYIRLPHWNDWSRLVMADAWPGYVTEHFHFFTRQSISHWLSANGFEPVYIGTRGDSRYWLGGVRRKLSRKTAAPSPDQPQSHVPSASVGQMRLVEALDWAAFPFLWMQGALNAGSELIAIARKRA